MGAASEPHGAPSLYHRERRLFTLGTCWFQFFISGVFYGLSPMALPVSQHFGHEADDVTGGLIFHGFGVLMAVQAVACVFTIFYVHPLPFPRRKKYVLLGHLAWPAGLGFLALAVQLRSVWMLLGLAFPLMGVGIGLQVGYVHLVLITIVWGQEVNRGVSLSGGCSALGALVWNFVFGETVNALGFDRVATAMWIFFGIHALGIAFGLLLLNPMNHFEPPPGVGEEDAAAGQGEQGQLESVPSSRRSLSTAQLARDWRVYVFTFVVEAFFFAGLTMKTLMSELFEKILRLEYIHAVRYSGACLAAYTASRFGSPLLAFGDSVFLIFLGVLAVEGLAYSLTPTAIDLGSGSAVVYTAFRVVGGMGFAILKSNTSVLLVRIFGSENCARISGIFLATEAVIGVGPSLAFVLHVRELRNGTSSAHSYDLFFYFSSVLVLAACLGVCVLWWSMGRRGSGKHRGVAGGAATCSHGQQEPEKAVSI